MNNWPEPMESADGSRYFLPLELEASAAEGARSYVKRCPPVAKGSALRPSSRDTLRVRPRCSPYIAGPAFALEDCPNLSRAAVGEIACKCDEAPRRGVQATSLDVGTTNQSRHAGEFAFVIG